MSAGLWFFQWDTTKWGGGSTPPAPVVSLSAVDAGAGSGKFDEYIRAGDDFWAVREQYLLNLRPEPAFEPPRKPETRTIPTPPEVKRIIPLIPRLTSERKVLVQQIQSAPDFSRLRAYDTRLRELDKSIRLAQYFRYLNQLDAKERRRQRKIKLLKSTVAKLVALKGLIDIFYATK